MDTRKPPSDYGPSFLPHESNIQAAVRTRTTNRNRATWLAAHPKDTCQDFAHHQHTARRELILEALRRIPGGTRVYERVATCASRTMLFKTLEPPHLYGTRTLLCNHRLCPLCSATLDHRRRIDALHRCPETHFRLSFLTLTQRATPGEPLRAAYRRLMRSFKLLRKSDLWKQYVWGGLAITELTYNHEHKWYHVHLHVILDAMYLPMQELTLAWKTVANGSDHIHIRAAGENNWHLSEYLAQYLAAPLPTDMHDDPDLTADFIQQMKGLRLSTYFGKWAGKKTKDDAREFAKSCTAEQMARAAQWIYLGDLDDLIRKARAGSVIARTYLHEAGFSPIQLDLAPSNTTNKNPPPKADQLGLEWTDAA